MEAPLCPNCWQLNLGDHQCPKEDFPGQLIGVRKFYRRTALNEWNEYQKKEEQRKLKEEKDAEIRTEIEELNIFQQRIKHLIQKTIAIVNFAKDVQATMLADSRDVVDTNEAEIKDKMKQVRDLLSGFDSDYSKRSFITIHANINKQNLIAEIDSQMEEFSKMSSTVDNILSDIYKNVTIYANEEERLSQPKFAKDTPREVKRGDRGTGAKSSKDIHGIDGDDNGEYRRGFTSGYDGY